MRFPAAALAVLLLLLAGRAPAADTWTEVKSPHFTAVGNASEGDLRTLAWRFEQIRSAFTHMIPELKVDGGRPLVLIGAKNEKALRALAPEFWETATKRETISVSVSGTERHFVAVQMDVSWESASRTAYWQYAQILMNERPDGTPLWLREGLAELYQSTVVEEDRVTVGQPTRRQIEILRGRTLLPVPDVMLVDRKSDWYLDPTKREIFSAQAWVLVHHYLFGNKGANAGQFRDLTRRLAAGVPAEEAVRQTLGEPAQIASRIQEYVRAFQFPMWRKPADVDVPGRKTYAARPLPEADALAWQAEFHVAMGRPVEARQMAELAEKADPKSSRAAEVQALLAVREKRDADVKAWAAKAVERDASNAVAQWLLADQLVDAQDPGAEAALRRAVELRPGHAEAHAQLAYVLARAKRDLPKAMELAKRAVELDQARAWYHLVLAHVQQESGQREEALLSLRRAKAVARPWDASSIREYSRWLEGARP